MMYPVTKLNRIRRKLSIVLEKIIKYDKYGILNKKDLKVIKNEAEVLGVRIKHLKDVIDKGETNETDDQRWNDKIIF